MIRLSEIVFSSEYDKSEHNQLLEKLTKNKDGKLRGLYRKSSS